MLPVESIWTMFGRRLMQFPPQGQSSSPAHTAKAQTNGKKKHQKGQVAEGKGLLEKDVELRADISLKESRPVIFGTVPLFYNSVLGCNYGEKCRFRHVEADGQKSKKSGVKDQLALLLESIQLVCVSQDCHPRKSVPREEGKLGSNHTVKFPKGTWHHFSNSGKKGSIARRHSEVRAS